MAEAGRIHKIILYGSYARGDWVYEPHTKKGYRSDYDLLIVVNHKTVLLVRTFYTPYVHDLVKLRGQAELIDPRLQEAWPRDKPEDADAFETLQQAYVKARYIKDFHVGAEKLAWLGARTAQGRKFTSWR